MIMSLKQKKIKFKPRTKLNHNMNNETIIRFSLSYDLNNYVDLGGCYAPSARHLHNSSDHTQLNHTDQTNMLIINFQR